jgi:hypothetical protein
VQRLPKFLPSCIAVLGLDAIAVSQSPPVVFEESLSIPWPGASTSFRRVISGDFTGDAVCDAVILAGDQAVFLDSPQDRSQTLVLAGTFRDVDVGARIGPDGATSIAGVGTGGLVLQAFDAGSGTFTVTPITSSEFWTVARFLRCADINDTGVIDYVAVGGNLRTVVVRKDTEGIPEESTFLVPYEVLDVVLLQWDFDPALEIAFLDTHGVDVYEQTGSLAKSFANDGVPGDAITVFRVDSDARDRIAWVERTDIETRPRLLELSKRNPIPVVSIVELPFAAGVFAAAADSPANQWPADGNSELVLAHAEHCAPLLLVGQVAADPSPHFLLDPPSRQWEFVTGGSLGLQGIPGAMRMPLGYADLDGDSLPDLLIPVADVEGARVEYLSGRSNTWGVDSADAFVNADLPDAVTPWEYPALGQFLPSRTLTLELSPAIAPAAGTPNCVEVVVWRQAGIPSPPPPQAIDHGYYLLSSSPAGAPLRPDVMIPEALPCFPHVAGAPPIYWIEVRMATVDTQIQKIIKTWPTYVAYVGTEVASMETLFIDTVSEFLCFPAATKCDGDLDFCPLSDGTTHVRRTPSGVTRPRMAPSSGTIPPPAPLRPATWHPN